ncbi:hypothetical protein [Microbacterium sp. 69-10]|uniref:hypothetical protein n=1 Tax=Microbacterium sp. 69-10 TaxID=1895783 RepID=UPI0025F5196C|nr:hypothetical protein [Microbacterium sp. 69-10]
MPVAYPFIVLLPVVVPFSQQLNKRWIVYARTRTGISRYLAQVALLNCISAFLVFFLYVVITFVVLYFAGGALGAVYDPGGYSHPSGEHIARLTALEDISPTLYMFVYATWQGINAAIWATIGLVSLLVVRRRILAFAAPFMIFVLLSLAMGVLGEPFAWNTPWLLWVLFSVSDVPFLASILTLAVFSFGAVIAVTLVIRRADRLSVLQ